MDVQSAEVSTARNKRHLRNQVCIVVLLVCAVSGWPFTFTRLPSSKNVCGFGIEMAAINAEIPNSATSRVTSKC